VRPQAKNYVLSFLAKIASGLILKELAQKQQFRYNLCNVKGYRNSEHNAHFSAAFDKVLESRPCNRVNSAAEKPDRAVECCRARHTGQIEVGGDVVGHRSRTVENQQQVSRLLGEAVGCDATVAAVDVADRRSRGGGPSRAAAIRVRRR